MPSEDPLKKVAKSPVKSEKPYRIPAGKKPVLKPQKKTVALTDKKSLAPKPSPKAKAFVLSKAKSGPKKNARSAASRARLVKPKVTKRPPAPSLRPIHPHDFPALALNRFAGNPIIQPTSQCSWASRATFNPAAIQEGGKVHLLYRALGDSDISVLGHAVSADGFNIERVSVKPAFLPPQWTDAEPRKQAYQSPSGGGTGGSEDPRAVSIDGRIYVTYTDFNGWCAPRVALTSIDTTDFLKQKWSWKDPTIISPPNEMHKNWVIFPEKINGKFAILHSITPDVLVDYFDSLDFDGATFIESKHHAPPRKGFWDTRVRGVGPPPIKTKYGWLVLYHATDDLDPGRYKLGAMILDANDPTQILYRSAAPILEPDEEYENFGFKAGVVYSCGALVVDGKLVIYYGGADSVVCVASADLESFLDELMKSGAQKVKAMKIGK